MPVNCQVRQVVVNLLNFFLDDFLDDDDGSEMLWEKVTVNVEEYRTMGDPSFRMHFRLTKPVFEKLLIDLKDHLLVQNRLQRERRNFSHIVLMVLWILATPDSFRSVALRFGVHPGTVHEYYVYVIEALREMGGRFIMWPNEHRRHITKTVLQRKSRIRGVVGIIDVCHIPISAPLEEPAAYRDYKHQYSLSVQVVCDHRYQVIDLYVGEAGSLHDARVFRRSPLCLNLLQKPGMLSGGEHIIGDSAYMLLDSLITPFENNGHLTPRQLNFNRRLCQIRCRVEHTFGHAKSLWRRLQYFPHRNIDYGLDHVVACFVLHNYRILNGEEMEMYGEIGDPIGEDNEPAFIGPRRGNRQGAVDLLPDPHVPQGDVAAALNQSRLRGDQKRWDLCNDLPMD